LKGKSANAQAKQKKKSSLEVEPPKEEKAEP